MVKFNVRKQGELITPSGIKVGLLSLLGKHQALITNQSDKKRLSGFEEMLFDCIDYIGEKSKDKLTKKDILRLLETDRKAILFKLRQLSNNDNSEFIFDYEFPTENGQKLKDRKVVDFNNENFPIKPFSWVLDQMKTSYMLKYKLKNLNDDQIQDVLKEDIPEMFDSYDDILNKYQIQEFKLPECGIKVSWKLLTAEGSTKFQGIISEDNVNSHTQIQMHSPTYVNEELSKGRENPVNQPVPLDDLGLLDIEALRKNIIEVEGSVDSSIVVQYKNDVRKQQQLDLVTMPAFFFPSLAI